MATVVQIPGSLSLAGNIQDIIISSAGTVNFKILDNGEMILEENYDPDASGLINIRLRDLLPTLLYLNIPESDVFEQTYGAKTFTFVIDGVSSNHAVVLGGINASIDALTFLKSNWLTWQPQQKNVRYTDPEWLSYYATEAINIKLKAYFKDTDSETIILTSLLANKLYSLNVNFQYLSGLFTSGQPVYFDIWTENATAVRLSFIQRYVLIATRFEFNDLFLFTNTVGGLDTVRFYGNKEEDNKFDISSALFDEDTFDYDIDFNQVFTKNTGYAASERDRAWFNEFFVSKKRWFVTPDGLKQITVSDPEAKIDHSDPSSFYYEFKFALSRQTKYLNFPRADELPDNVEIIDPDEEVFFLAPRLIEFPDAVIDPLLLFPVQNPFVQEWKKLSYGALRDAIVQAIVSNLGDIIGASHIHFNKTDLDKLTIDVGYLLINGIKAKAGDSDALGGRPAADHYHKDNANREDKDWMAKDISVVGDIMSHDFVTGISGHKITSAGNAEMNSLRLRQFLEVPELRYNRVSVFAGDQWRAPGGGIIQSVDTINKIITLKLEEGEIGAIAENDICMGIFHSLTSGDNATENGDDGIGNRKFAGFATAYFRVTEIVETQYNSQFSYELRPVSDQYPAQIHPMQALHFVCYGNFTNSDRQTSQYATTKYERYLANVNGWEFTVGMIMAQFGDLSNLSLFGIDMTGYSAFLNNIYMSGVIHQFEMLPPYMEIDTEGDSFLAAGETMNVTCRVMKGFDDITATATSWSISRDSGDATEDLAWNLAHTSFAGLITLGYDDLGKSLVSTLFTMTASGDDGAIAQGILTI